LFTTIAASRENFVAGSVAARFSTLMLAMVR